MTLHIFNPEHDLALASGLSNFTAPHAGGQLRHDLGFLPATWAQEGDTIMVDDPEQAERAAQKLAHRVKCLLGTKTLPQVNWESSNARQVASRHSADSTGQNLRVEPWGWNSALRAMLIRKGVGEESMPTLPQLDTIRELSHRRTAANLLKELRIARTTGESFECRQPEKVEALLAKYRELVMKAPWSSSGRGLRFLSAERTPFEQQANWFRNIVNSQGSVMVEPYYNKMKDFGMEFYSDGKGGISYLGLSLFHTANGAYTGNILATEKVKREMISRYLPTELLDNVQEKICQRLSATFKGCYEGPFGVDMMIVQPSTFHLPQTTLHPCVEINLRRTMGHVALSLAPQDDDIRCVMCIAYSDNYYKLTINKL